MKEKEIIKYCINDITVKYTRDHISSFTHADFIQLSDDIFEVTKISISVSTLKRIWRDDYVGTPNISTLNAFAQYLGYKHWRDYRNTLQKPKVDLKKTKPFISMLKWILLFSGLFGIGVLSYKVITGASIDHNVGFEIIKFDSTQLPAHIVFQLDLSSITADSAIIRPIGPDISNEQFKVSKFDTVASYTYIRPWICTPSLIINGKAIKTIPINFTFDHWIGGVSNSRKKFYTEYFEASKISNTGTLTFTPNFLSGIGFQIEDIDYTTFDYFRPFDRIDTSGFNFQIGIKSTPITKKEGSGDVSLLLCFDYGFVAFQFTKAMNPYNQVTMVVLDKVYTHSNTDLSFLQMDMDNWNAINIVKDTEAIKLIVNDTKRFSTKLTYNPGQLKGIQLDFQGLGSIDYYQISSLADSLLYSNEFEL